MLKEDEIRHNEETTNSSNTVNKIIGPKAIYVNIGNNGVFYSETADFEENKIMNNSKSYENNYPGYAVGNYYSLHDAIKVSVNTGRESELGEKILSNIKRPIKAYILLLVAMSCVFVFSRDFETPLFIGTLLRIVFNRWFRTRVFYSIEEESFIKWNEFIEALGNINLSNSVWIVETTQRTYDRKRNAGAYNTISRVEADIKLLKPKRNTLFGIKTNVRTVMIKSKRCKVLFLPTDILIQKGNIKTAYSYDQLDLKSSFTRFIEDSRPARDAEIVDYTWQYVNKDGSADRRFNYNRKKPICKYGVLELRVGNALNIEIQTSNNGVTYPASNAYDDYARYVKRLGTRKTYSQPVSRSAFVDTNKSYQSKESAEEIIRRNQINNIIRDQGSDLALSLRGVIPGKTSFIDGQLYQKHAVLLFETEVNSVNYMTILNTHLNNTKELTTLFESVDDHHFVSHMYMDIFETIENDGFVSLQIKNALNQIDTNKSKDINYDNFKEDTNNYNYNNDSHLNDVVRSGVNLFDDFEIKNQNNVTDNLNNETDNPSIDELFDYFEKDE